MNTRLCKIALTASVALFLVLVVLNNLTDYGSNLLFVQNVLGMTDTFPGNKLMWRALTSPAIHHAFYWSIILWEAAAMVLCAAGAWKLWLARSATAREFDAAKSLAITGLTVSLLQWFVAFITVGGEWFVMWQSKTWNGQDAAFRMFACIGIILLFVNQSERTSDKSD
jgi:predicted small integral membrane protein